LTTTKKPPLTKEQKFNLNIIYKPKLFNSFSTQSIQLSALERLEKDDKFLLRCITERLNLVFLADSESLYKFLDEYKEQLNWNEVLKNLTYEVHIDHTNNVKTNVTLNKILPRYSQYFSSNCWNYITQEFRHGDEDLIREYKDKLNWNYLSKYYDFSLEFMKEMVDYINMKHFFNHNNVYYESITTRNRLLKFLKTHINEVN